MQSSSELLQHERYLRVLARRLVGDDAAADDLVQETWVVGLERAPDRGALRPWLAGVVRNLARNRTRAEARRRVRESASARPGHGEGSDPSELSERIEVLRALADLVLELREPWRATVLLRYYEGLSTEDIARQLSTTQATVRSNLKRGLDDLRERAQRRFDGERALGVFLAPLLAPRARVTPARALPAAAATPGAVAAAVVLALTASLLPPAERTERAEPRGLARQRPAAPIEVAPLAAAPDRSSLAAAAVAPVSLRLLALHGGHAIPDFLVRVEHAASGTTLEARTDGGGLLRTPPLPAGQLRLTLVDDEGFESDPPDAPLRLMPGAGEPVFLEHDPELADAEPLELTTYAGPCYTLELDLPPGVTAEGLRGELSERDVHDLEAGERASVVFGMRRGGPVTRCSAPVRTSPGPGSGPWIRFPLQATQLRGDAPWRLELRDAQGFLAGSALVFDKTGVAGHAHVDVRRTGKLRARLVGGARPASWRVVPEGAASAPHTPRLGPGQPALAEVLEGGLPPGSYRLHLDAWGAAPLVAGFEVVAGRETRLDCELEDLAPGGRIAGIVRSASGSLPPRTRLRVHDRGRGRTWIQPLEATDEAGRTAARFALEDVPAGSYDVELISSAAWVIESNRATVAPPDEGLVFEILDGSAELVVDFEAVHARSGAPVKRFVLCVTPPGAGSDAPVLHRAVRGHVQCGGMTLDPGLRWRILAEGCVPFEGNGQDVALQDSGRGRVRAELVRGWGATLRVRDGEGRRLPEVRVLADGQELGRTDSRGELVVRRGRTPGRLVCERAGWRTAEALPPHRDVAGLLEVTLRRED